LLCLKETTGIKVQNGQSSQRNTFIPSFSHLTVNGYRLKERNFGLRNAPEVPVNNGEVSECCSFISAIVQ